MSKHRHSSNLNQAIVLLKRTLPEMSKRRVPVTPENYTVWYEYITGNNPQLAKAINSHIAANLTFTDEFNAFLYKNYIESAKSIEIEKIQLEVRKLIEELLTDISNSGEDLSAYGAVLEKFTQQVEQENNVESIRNLVLDLIIQTRNQEESTLLMKRSLQSMTEEIHSLRKEIEKLTVASSIDPLTRVANRTKFDSELACATEASSENETPLCLVIVDIDHFKVFNDRFGHLTGDKVLKYVSAVLKKNTKGQDTVARFGGEEFALILPDTDYEAALTVANNIRKRISTQNLMDSMEQRQLGTITVSAGVAVYHRYESTDVFIQRADECLYAAKHAGRDCILGEREITTPVLTR